MTEFGMSAIHAAIELTVQYNPAAYSSPYRNVNESRLIPSGSPARFGQSTRVRIVFQRHAESKHLAQVFHQILPSPLGKEIKITKLPSERIYWPRGANADSRYFCPGVAARFAKHAGDSFHAIGVVEISAAGRFSL
jgi:hypothetical protein